jgi:hypothetical protein
MQGIASYAVCSCGQMPQVRKPGRKGNTRPNRVRNASPPTTCKCDECLEAYPGGRTLSRRQAARHALEKAEQFEQELAGDAELAYAVAQSFANGEEPNNSDFEPADGGGAMEGEGDDDAPVLSDGDDGAFARSDVDEDGDLSMVDLVTDDESETDIDDESEEEAGFGAMGPSWAMRGTEPAPLMGQAGGEAVAGGDDPAGLPVAGLAPQAPNLRPAPRSRPILS